MLTGRSESRTEDGWQRFDRVAFIVTMLLLLALLIVWLTGTSSVPVGSEPPLVQAAGESNDVALATAAQSSSAIDKDAPQANDKDASQANAGQTARVDSAMPGDKASDLAAAGSADPVAAVVPAVTGPAQQKSAADEPESPGARKSLASQDPARQATFERIPKYLDRPISAKPEAAQGNSSVAKDIAGPALPAAAAGGRPNGPSNSVPSVVMAVGNGPKVEPILELRSSDGSLTIDGIVSSEKVRADILKAGLKSYGMRNLTDRLAVNAAVEPFQWADDVADLIVLIGGPENETTLRIDGNTVTLTGEVPALEDKQARALAAQQLFGTRARIDNRLRVVATGGSVGPADVREKSVTAMASETPEKTSDESAEPPASDLAEGGPGQTDQVVLSPTPVPDKINRGDCPRIATGVLIPFGSASTELTDAARSTLDALKPCLLSRDYLVGGHTDSRGLALNNLILSQARAQAVVDYLVAQGVPAGRLTPKGYGESKPIISNGTERGRARNRRIDFRFNR